MKTNFKLGDWNFKCDTCDHKRKGSTGRWTTVAGVKQFFVCQECWDRDHPANIPAPPRTNEGAPPPVVRPDSTVYDS